MPEDPNAARNEAWNERSRQDPTFNPRDALWDSQRGMFEARLRDEAKKVGNDNYDMAELQDIERWVKDADNSGRDASPALAGAIAKIQGRFKQNPGSETNTPGSNNPGPSNNPPSGGTTTYTPPSSTAPPSNAPYNQDPAIIALLERQASVVEAMQREQTARQAAMDTQRDTLYNQLLERAQQGLEVDENSPWIRRQSDVYSARTKKAERDYLADEAEAQGPYANLGSERRVAAERFGQQSAGFEANLLAQEVQQRRAEIESALNSMRGLLTADQQAQLQSQLGALDALSRQYTADTGRMGTYNQGNNDLLRTMLQNDQFTADLGFRVDDRNNYWDALRSGYNV